MLEQVAQGDCGVFILRDMQNHVRSDPGQPDLVDSALIDVVGIQTSRDVFQPQLCCDSALFNKDKSGATEGQQVYS